MSTPRRGVLYWGHLDKRRPVLIVSSERFNLRAGHVCVVPGTTRLRPFITHVPLARGEGGVERPTMLLCEHLTELRVGDFEPDPFGPPLTPGRMRSVEEAIRHYLGLDVTS